jgi:hypothetical protein
MVCSKEFPQQKTVPIKTWREREREREKEGKSVLVIGYDRAIKFSCTIPRWINTEIGITVTNCNTSFDHKVLSLTTTSRHFQPLLCHTFGLWLNGCITMINKRIESGNQQSSHKMALHK